VTGKLLEPGQIEAAAERPPFIHLPPHNLFALRASQFDALANDHPLGDYLRLLAGVCRAQQQVLDQPPTVPELSERRIRESLAHGLPPLSADTLVRENGWQAFLDAWLDQFYTADNPLVRAALARLHRADEPQRRAWAVALLAGQYEGVPAELVPFLGAGLQVAWSHWLFGLRTRLEGLPEPGELTHCPCCGAPPMAGVIQYRGKLNGLRYLVCSLCAAEWHFVRLKCSRCLSTRELEYVRREGTLGDMQAEACPDCHGYLKLLYLERRSDGECLSADLATLDLDLLLNDQGYHRMAPNLLLAPGGEA
jgi:FdhE protein